MSDTDNNGTVTAPTTHNEGAIPSTVALLAGAAAGTTVDVCLFPIDTVKTRLQSSQGFIKAGGFRGIYSGVSAAFAGSAPAAALFFTTYESLKPIIHNRVLCSDKQLNSNPLSHMFAAGFGETAACLVRVPTEVVKQRMQTGQYQYFTQALREIMTSSLGFRGFYAGYSTTVFREIPFSFIQFPMWERLKKIGAEYTQQTELKPWQGALCGSIAGGVAAAATTPLDVIKTRLMLGCDKHGNRYKGFFDTVTRLTNEEGAAVFFRGIGPRVTWIFIGGFFFFGAYEKSKSLLTPIWLRKQGHTSVDSYEQT